MLNTRFAPSPTGLLHLGNLRTALLSYLWSKKHNAKFILRIDDTDRVEEQYIEQLQIDLNWMGISWDSKIHQSQRNEIYNHWFDICVERGLIYDAYDTKEELDSLRTKLIEEKKAPVYKKINRQKHDNRKPHWRFALANVDIKWNDVIRKNIKINLRSVSDPVIKKEDGSYTYMFTSVIDDIDQKISHIFRGEDHVTNTAIQIYMFEQINNHQVTFGHLPILLNQQGSRMSKRNKDESIQDLRNEGFLPITLATQMLFLGQNNMHIETTLENLVQHANFDYSSAQIKWSKDSALKIQRSIIAQMSQHEVKSQFNIDSNDQQYWNESLTHQHWDAIKSEITFKQDITTWNHVFTKLEIISNEKINPDDYAENTQIAELTETTDWHIWLEQIKALSNRKIMLKKLRAIITGQKFGPKLPELFDLIPHEIILFRIKHALQHA